MLEVKEVTIVVLNINVHIICIKFNLKMQIVDFEHS